MTWVGVLFAFSIGPPPGVSGVFGPNCNQNGCHAGGAVNAPGGALTLSGLPERWTPGQTYLLTVSIQRTGAARYGFQLSAVSDSTTTKAGSFSIPAGETGIWAPCFVGTQLLIVSCSTPGAIQYAGHDVPSVSGVFRVNWTAPSNANSGIVRFNLAANAANGNGQVTGDFIYTREDFLSPLITGVSSRSFSIANLGASLAATDGSGSQTVGYARIQPDASNTAPAGVAIFGYRQAGALVSEAAVPVTAPMASGRISAKVGGSVNTGLAIANPNSTAATVSFHFTDSLGNDFGNNSTVVTANGQISAFLHELPFNGGNNIDGTFSFSSNVPVSVIALRGYTNERGEFLMTTQPVTNTSAPTSTSPVMLPHFAEGGGWTTQVVLVNPTDTPLSGSVQFWGQGSGSTPGTPLNLTVNGQPGSTFGYSIPRRSSYTLKTSGAPPLAVVGSVRVTPANSPAPSSAVVFTYKPANITVSEAGVPSTQGNSFRVYVETTSSVAAAGSIQTGIAIANDGATPNNVTLELFRLDGSPAGVSTPLTIPANGQIAKFLHELFPASWALPFQGVLRVSSSSGAISVIGLRGRYNERDEFLVTTMHAANETAASSNSDLFFPHLATGGGFTTQFVLFSGTANQTSAGNLLFFGQDGAPLFLTLQ
jgi:hypothetical protein